MGARLARGLLVGLGVFAASRAHAAEVTPPEALGDIAVEYPVGAQGDAAVVLELLVDAKGSVREGRVVSGMEPFASAALDAAMRWTFAPARRDGAPVSARIRMEVDLHGPSEAPPDAAPAAVVAVVPAVPAPAPLTPIDVNVRGTRTEIGQTRLGGAEVRQIPGAFGDAFRAIEALPGVTPIVSGLPFFFVRGAPAGNVGYFIDGVRVPLLYHLALGPSVIHPGLIDHVDFYPGGYPAKYGRYAGGILDGATLPPAERLHGEANVRLFDAGLLAEAPLLDGRLTVLAAGRYSYTAALVQLVAKDTRVAYWDYQARAEYKLSRTDRVSVFWFGSFDEIDTRNTPRRDVKGQLQPNPFYPVFKTEFHRLDMRYDHDTPRGHFRFGATLGIEDSLTGSGNGNSQGVASRNAQLRAEGEERLNPDLKLRYGADVLLDHYTINTGQSASLDLKSLFPTRNDVMIGAYADSVWKASRRVEVVPGFRADVFTSRLASPSELTAPANDHTAPLPGAMINSTAALGLDPRLATRFVASPVATWVTTFGVSHQPPSLVVPIPGLTLGLLDTGLQTSLQASQGVELSLPLDVTLTATAFLQGFIGLSDATTTCLDANGSTNQNGNGCLAEKVNGRAYGLEILARRELTKRFTGWISYTLSRSTRDTHGLPSLPPQIAALLPPGNYGPQEIASEFDRTHVFDAVGAFDLGAGWRAGLRFFFYTGRPYSREFDGKPVPPFNSMRMPPFWRLDVRLEKRWRVFGRGYLTAVLEGLNVTLNKEAVFINCNHEGDSMTFDTCEPQYIGPVSVPSLGVEGGF
jgi:hypothetical protein